MFWDAHWSWTRGGNGQCPTSSVRILTLRCFALSWLSPRGLTAATTAQLPLLMLQSRGQIPAATRHVRLWDEGNGVPADPALPRRSSAHMQQKGCGVALAGGWGACPTNWCEANEGLIPVSPLRYGGLQMQDQPCDPTAKASRSHARAMMPSASIAIVGWGHGAEIPLLIRSATVSGENRGASLLYPTPFGLQVRVLPTQNNDQKGSACGIPTCWRRMVAAQAQAPCPSCQPNKARELPRSTKVHPFISQSKIRPAPISLQTPAISVGRGGAIACRSKTAAGVNGAGRAHRAGMAGYSFGIRSRCSSPSLLSAEEEMHQAAEQCVGHGGAPRTTAPCRAHLPRASARATTHCSSMTAAMSISRALPKELRGMELSTQTPAPEGRPERGPQTHLAEQSCSISAGTE